MDLRVGNGNAGLASHFLDLAHAKTRPGGVIALVLPASFAQGGSWKAARQLIETDYRNIVVVAIAATGNTDRAFSADTGMAEVLLVATKREEGEPRDGSALFANLRRRPQSLLEATEVARAIRAMPATGPSAGWLLVGSRSAFGCYIRDNLDDSGAAGVANPGIADAMLALFNGRLRLPRERDTFGVPMTPLSQLGERGPLHRDLSGRGARGSPRGALGHGGSRRGRDSADLSRAVGAPRRTGALPRRRARSGRPCSGGLRASGTGSVEPSREPASLQSGFPGQLSESGRLPHARTRDRRKGLAELSPSQVRLGKDNSPLGEHDVGPHVVLVEGVSTASGTGFNDPDPPATVGDARPARPDQRADGGCAQHLRRVSAAASPTG